MASGRDVRDMLGLPMGGDAPKAAQKSRPKPATGVRRPQGVAREVAALYGERPPPVAIYEEKKTYRAKRQSTGPAKKWVQQPFTNQARSDGLVLRHWRRKPTTAPPITSGEDTVMEDSESSEPYIESNGDFMKYNIEVEVPQFTDEEYDAHLRSNDWGREETDYLFQKIKDYAFRWAVIWDRYDFQAERPQPPQDDANGDSTALATLPFAPAKARTVEDLKARYYDIAAKIMKLRIPEVQMDAEQFAQYDLLTKFNPDLERNRKTLAAALMNRNMDEVKEEEFLLTELQRINMAANRLDAERDELRARLEAPAPQKPVEPGLTAFPSSQQLATLFNQLFQQDKSKKRAPGNGPAGRLSLSANEMVATPGSAQQQQMAAANRRQSVAQPPPQTPIRQLAPQQEIRFNVSTHDRLTSGVSFGSDKLLKMRQAKSNVQTQKIAAALAQLSIPEIIPIPTSKVGDVFEALIGKVGKLLDVRKVREKEEGECRVLEAMKTRRASESQAGAGDASNVNDSSANYTPAKSEVADSQDTPDVDGDGEDDGDDGDNDGGEGDGDADVDAEGEEDDDEDAEGEDADTSAAQSERRGSTSTRAVSAGHKRSASVLSQASSKSNKRLRK
ncbi:hypothetical protein BU24DRAFT_373287 [Aaosphaeria arxii CBS 175.79]|uniref:SWR1-complex protein 4 n=1 Tax=Aaosphaeria arxii CBS 175.79 TaxID=1450172 RepID=A0A6A5XKA2_9PLEO|nr:uncharacterized protein BU24DRAFT_373287 [Aaosphaeria arxii CBS 175.79]KAF2013708.1 hypothetical protein BU24DRAFT_373287 [Aaosphaeria arxii CBS 175.79]